MLTKDIFKNGVSLTRELIITILALGMTTTVVGYLGYLVAIDPQISDYPVTFALQGFAIFFLIYGNYIYLVSRYGYLRRLQQHYPTSKEELSAIFEQEASSLTILVPSYKEEIPTIRQTLLSTALQEYPNRRVVLLIDDPPGEAQEAVELIHEIKELLEKPSERFQQAYDNFLKRNASGNIDLQTESLELSNLHREVAEWFEREGELFAVDTHVDETFVTLTFLERAKKHRSIDVEGFDHAAIEREYRRLASIFQVEITSFQRKKYENLSHAPNKAMNLNSYLGLMGKNFIEEGNTLREVPADKATLSIPDSTYVAMLDADSILTHDYALRLAHQLQQPKYKRVAVIQTPYSAFSGASGILERIAGATTDLQYIVHQGFTHFGATFWVGANALVRKCALDEIVEDDEERGHPIKRYIQDRTVIEDTESSIDLVDRGWQLHNYPERLSYSATPPDFGSLLIQRRRWANGGLLILPKLIKYVFRRPWSIKKLFEGFIRFHYLASIAGLLLGLTIFTIFPIRSDQVLVGIFCATLPYLAVYSRDLKLTGYRYTDLFMVIALNLLLIPVNLAGVLKSLQQACTGKHFPFCRTPKIQGRTFVPRLYLALELLLVGYAVWLVQKHIFTHEWTLLVLNLSFAIPLVFSNLAFLKISDSRKRFTLLEESSKLQTP